ncbi:MAG: hypothetical protein NTY01_08775 [Verrucomicrobia bacterium]|nr:hypothetical protein [Verrucomicrobiota bacterium]
MQTEFPFKATLIGGKTKVEIVPGVKITPVSIESVSRFAIARWVPQGDGTFKPVAKSCDPWVRLTVSLPRELGLGISWDVMRRLIVSGIVASRRPGPHTTEISIESLNAHLEGCRDTEYWCTPVKGTDGRTMTREARYKEAL